MKKSAPKPTTQRKPSALNSDELLETLRERFEKHMSRHAGRHWSMVEASLRANHDALRTVSRMEATGGEPDVVDLDRRGDDLVFVDCAPQSPSGRRSLCYDREALESRKEHKPKNSAMDLASEMGVELLTEEQYVALQKLGDFDTTTSSWLKTPEDVRENGGAIFGDRRFGRVFIYHNGAESYYAARGFRGAIRIGASRR